MADFPRWPFDPDDVLQDWSEGRMSIERAAKYLHLQYHELLALAVRKGFSMPKSDLYGVSEMDDFRLTYDATKGVSETLTKAAKEARYLEEYVSIFESDAEEGSTREAQILFRQAAREMRNSVRALEAAAAWVAFASWQVASKTPEMTALTAVPPEEKMPNITPLADFWDGGPVWEIFNLPLAGSDSDYWWLAIEDTDKAYGVLKVIAFVHLGDHKTARAIPIFTGPQFTRKDPEYKRTVAMWIEIAREKAEAYIAAFDPAVTDESAAEFQKRLDDHAAKRHAEEWGEPVPE
ncbi:hypothetical protein HFO91_30390 [Rhizobium leguminosarum]|uniref:hypothetical protein n=1 Tax=Rhizobium leguminosarum TaxID=384 RepID=UPI001C94953A|nr:hypothetical protein [Rhizobium leguminosarum]MBY5453889.1 hypothetical protein [Rhizobium leguminosarum]